MIEPEVEHTSSYFADDANSPKSLNAAATVVNLRGRLTRPWARRLSPFIAVDNAFNTRYDSSVVINAAGGRYFEPAPGRNFYLGMSVFAGRGGLAR
jgi:iron complex outermembrane receptor protein